MMRESHVVPDFGSANWASMKQVGWLFSAVHGFPACVVAKL